MMAPLASVTVPTRVPVVDCPHTLASKKRIRSTTNDSLIPVRPADSSPDLYGRTLEFLLGCFAMRRWICLLLLLAAGCSGETGGKSTLIVYSPHGKELLTEFEKRFEAQNRNVDVR